MDQATPRYIPPGLVARAFNRWYGWLADRGLGPSNSYLLQIKGRRTGQTRSLPVNVLNRGGRLFLVATRGHTQWSRNALATGQATLKRGRVRIEFRLRAVSEDEKPEILKAYLTRFNWTVRRFFPVRPDAALSAYVGIAAQYPVFELYRDR
jgi:deazaflavin-dependent oxidoreductase (nitroreductase family)